MSVDISVFDVEGYLTTIRHKWTDIELGTSLKILPNIMDSCTIFSHTYPDIKVVEN